MNLHDRAPFDRVPAIARFIAREVRRFLADAKEFPNPPCYPALCGRLADNAVLLDVLAELAPYRPAELAAIEALVRESRSVVDAEREHQRRP
jgi:hypothetical protein